MVRGRVFFFFQAGRARRWRLFVRFSFLRARTVGRMEYHTHPRVSVGGEKEGDRRRDHLVDAFPKIKYVIIVV